ncbi:MAG: hypothetical protein AAFY38_02200 [Pseudomonadota bacterium]
MSKLFQAAALVGAFFLPGAAVAEGYSVSDLGNAISKEVCLQAGENAVRAYDSTFGAGQINVANWTVYGWDMTPGDQDTVIICTPSTLSSAESVRAVLVVYGEQESEQRAFTRDAMKEFWSKEMEPFAGDTRSSDGADGWSISDLGTVADRDTCMDRAVNALETWPSNRRTEVSRGNWAVYAYNLSPGENHVVITCPVVSGQINAFIHIFGEDNTTQDDRTVVREFVKAVF